MLQIVILCVATLFVGNCDVTTRIRESAEFEVLIDGVNVGRSSSCIGENVTYVCNITTTNHVWNVPGSVTNRNLVWNNPPVPDGEYKLRVVSEDGTNIIASSLSVNSSAELNNTSITCAAGFDTNSTRATTVAMVLAPPSLPEMDVSQVMEENDTVNIMVTPPSVSPECVLQYIIITYSNCESIETNITVYPNNTDPTQPVQLTRGGLNLCTCSYNFTAVTVTSDGIGERSAPVTTIKDMVGNPNLTITNDGFNVTVSIAPEVVKFVIKYTNVVGTNVSLEMNGMAESKTLLECVFTNSRVDFFVELTSQCGMKSITDTTSPLPRLISSVTQSPSTINSIHLVLNVRECMGKDQLNVSSSVSDGNTVISQVNTSLNGMMSKLIHENMELTADKDYMCNVSILEGGTTLDFMSISCGTSSSSMSSSSPTTIIIIVIVCCVVLIAIIAVLACVICLKKKKGAGSGTRKEKSTPGYQEVAFTSSTNGPDTTDTGTTSKNNPPTYQDPSTIKHETAADGEVYTMVDKKSKMKKGKEEKGDVAVMYSMPDKSKKNPELMYADIQVSNPRCPPNNRGIGNRSVIQQDTSSVTYASVESPTTKF